MTAAAARWSEANGSSQVQAGPMKAETSTRPTQPYVHRNSDATSLSSERPPATTCATTHDQPTTPIPTSTSRIGRATRMRRSGAGTTETTVRLGSRMKTIANEAPTASAAPAR